MHNPIATRSNTEPAGSGYIAFKKTGLWGETTKHTEENTKKMSGIAGKTRRWDNTPLLGVKEADKKLINSVELSVTDRTTQSPWV